MPSPEFRDHIAVRADRVFDQVYEIEELSRANELAFRRDLREQREDGPLHTLLIEEEIGFYRTVVNASVGRYGDESLFETLLTPKSLDAFSMEPPTARCFRTKDGVLVLQQATGVDSLHNPFVADGIFLARKHARTELGYIPFPGSRVVRISTPEDADTMMLAERDKLISPDMLYIEEAVGLIHNYSKVMAERTAGKQAMQPPNIGQPILREIVSGPDDPDLPPLA